MSDGSRRIRLLALPALAATTLALPQRSPPSR